MRRKFLTLLQWAKACKGVGQPSNRRWTARRIEGDEDVQICDYRDWTETTADEEEKIENNQ